MDRDEAEKQIEETLKKVNDPAMSDEEKEFLHKKALNDYSAALASEFSESLAADEAMNNAPKFTQKFFREHLGFAAAGIVNLATSSTSDAVRAQCCRDIIKYAIGDAVASGDPWKELLNDLTKKGSPAAVAEQAITAEHIN